MLSLELADGQSMFISGLEDRIVQVLRNIIGNAASFSPVDGRIVIKTHQDGGQIMVSVEDDGPGVPPGSETRIFERFYQERPQNEKFGTHSGLGLSISKQIVETHGGELWAESRLAPSGEVLGARFVIRLPDAGQD